MGVGLGSLVSVGGTGGGGGGGSGSGITSINGQTGPAVVNVGVNGISVSAGGNQIVFNGAGLSGIIPATSGIESIQGDSGPHITLDGVNGLEVTPLGNGHILLDVSALSGVAGTGNACYTTIFANVIEQTFTHNLNTKAIIVQIQDTNDEFITADAIIAIDDDNVTVRFNSLQSGRITVVSCGGTTVAASGVTKFAASFLGITSGLFTHGFNTRDVMVQVYDNSGPPRNILPDDIILDTLDAVSLLFNVVQSGRVVIMG